MSMTSQKFPCPTSFWTTLLSTGSFTISDTRCRLYAGNVNEPDTPGLNVFGAERSFVIVANNKGTRKEVAMRTCILIEHGLDDNPLHGLLWYDHMRGNTNQTFRHHSRLSINTEHQGTLINASSLGVLKRKKGVMLQISPLSSTNAWSELLISLTHFCFFISQQRSSFLLSESL